MKKELTSIKLILIGYSVFVFSLILENVFIAIGGGVIAIILGIIGYFHSPDSANSIRTQVSSFFLLVSAAVVGLSIFLIKENFKISYMLLILSFSVHIFSLCLLIKNYISAKIDLYKSSKYTDISSK